MFCTSLRRGLSEAARWPRCPLLERGRASASVSSTLLVLLPRSLGKSASLSPGRASAEEPLHPQVSWEGKLPRPTRSEAPAAPSLPPDKGRFLRKAYPEMRVPSGALRVPPRGVRINSNRPVQLLPSCFSVEGPEHRLSLKEAKVVRWGNSKAELSTA